MNCIRLLTKKHLSLLITRSAYVGWQDMSFIIFTENCSRDYLYSVDSTNAESIETASHI